jgi:hypothetical protein
MNKYILLIVFVVVGLNISLAQEIRSIDGVGNNIANPTWGSAGCNMLRETACDYADGISEPKLGLIDWGRPNPRVISNALFAQDSNFGDPLNLSDFTWAFGQFIDHDVTLAPNSNELLDNIVVPEDDSHFLPNSILYMNRSLAAEGSGTSIQNPREHINKITSFLDCSAIYGSDLETAHYLRTFTNGKLRVSEGNLLPWNTADGEFNSPIDYHAPEMEDATGQMKKFFIAGDVRANENPLLIAFHTIFVREHNRLCDDVKVKHPGWDDERIYQEARRWLIGYIQNIAFNEWLPAMGITLPEYNGYNPNINPGIKNEFSAAAFRIGHTLLNSNILRLNRNGDVISQGHISLRDAFFNPISVLLAGGLEPYVQGMATQVQQDMDTKVVDDVRNFLFAESGGFGLDLVSININRARERGLPSYNAMREGMGKPSLKSFIALTGNQQKADLLEKIYTDINLVDPWVGMLAEKKENGALMGELMMHIIRTQFRNLRDGDRFYFENEANFTDEEIEKIRNSKMRDIIMRNTSITLMQDEVFKAMPTEMIPNGPELFPLDLEAVVYPNPVYDQMNLKVHFSKEGELTMKIINFEGRLIKEVHYHGYEGANIFAVDIPQNMPSGYYNVMVVQGDKFNVIKLIKR